MFYWLESEVLQTCLYCKHQSKLFEKHVYLWTMNYRLTVTEAFGYVQYIMTEANFDWLIRLIH
ncbi:hypothetical protein MTR_4g031190 [Medicago truncatula]|uniref:Cytochrome b/b6 N-terminal region profile domain-containing protein n=1 Tax=Medicago truncatula TaxID=3880 RepID=G7JLY0_MEDTR|nr:hypothetical protein MTR_4g031190 [Medicago truncatula]